MKTVYYLPFINGHFVSDNISTIIKRAVTLSLISHTDKTGWNL